MRTYDFSPLFRSTIGFDRLFDLVETAQRATEEGYPPYNIERLGRGPLPDLAGGCGLLARRNLDHRRAERRHRSKAARPKRPSASSSTGGSRPGISSGNSAWRTMSR